MGNLDSDDPGVFSKGLLRFMKHYRDITTCRLCGKESLSQVLDFGEQYLSSQFVKDNPTHSLSGLKVPLTAVLCQHCGLLQLGNTVDRELMYRDYYYRSGTTDLMKQELQKIVNDILSRTQIHPGDYGLDIGCNDGTMLSYFPSVLSRVGIDPAENIQRGGLDPSIQIVTDFFSARKVLKISKGSLFKIVSSIAMFYGLDDPNTITSEIKSILAPEGLWCLQVTYLPLLIKNMNFYDICHEHLLYFSLETLEFLMKQNGLKIFDISINETNGGSLRLFVGHQEDQRPVASSVHQLMEEERKLPLHETQYYQKFFEKILHLKRQVMTSLLQDKEGGGLIIGLGASTKGNVLLQFFGIDKKILPYLSDRNPEKVSLKTLGTDIEIISEERARELKPSCMLVLIWPFKEEVIQREQSYLKSGGKLLFPMPYCHVVTRDGEYRL